MIWLSILAFTFLLISINALYVAAEFSTVSTRRSRLAQIADSGNRMAQALQPIVENPQLLDRYIATCQLGITISSLMLGFFGQSTVADALLPLLLRTGWDVSEVAIRSFLATGVLLFLTVLQVLLGELVPKNIGLQYPERMAMIVSVPTRWSMALFRPLIWFFNGSGQLLMDLLGLSAESEHTHVHSPEEILMLVEESEAGGLLAQEERRLLKNTLRLRGAMVRQVMIPRTRMVAVPVDQSCDHMLAALAESPFSRLPIFEGSIDNIVGVVHLKDLLCLSCQADPSNVMAVMRPVLFVPETTLVGEVLNLLQRDRFNVAIVFDEYGGTAGMVTLKDLIDEIFGEFQEEFDVATPAYRLHPDRRLLVRGDTLVKDFNEWIDMFLPVEGVDTLGGLVLSTLGQVPAVGDQVKIEEVFFRVEKMDGKGIALISLELTVEQAQRLRRLSR